MQDKAGTSQHTIDAFRVLTNQVTQKLDQIILDGKLYATVEVYQARLQKELAVYDKSGYSSIILIISDYIRWAKANGIVVGPGRGSAAGSLVVYLADITTIDPIRFDLLFERFLNPERISLPDIDTDFSDRDAIINYLKDKYGRNHVVKVGVPSLFKPRSAIDEYAKVLKVAYQETKKITKLIGDSETFEEAFKAQPELEKLEQQYLELFMYAKKSQRIVRHITTHPSAVILTSDPIGSQIPLQKPPGDTAEEGELITAWDGEELDSMKFTKLDILTVDNLSVINETIKMLPADIQVGINFYDLPIDDRQTLIGFEEGDTIGIFQMEEAKTVGILKKLNGILFSEVCAVNALIRPGLDVSKFISNRNNLHTISYVIPQLEPILKDTYGIILYQEQVMKICVDIAGFSLPKADKVRKIIAKTGNQRSEKGLIEVYDDFKAGYLTNGLPQDRFDDLWQAVLACQEYIFNKAHATSYGYIAYADMYLKRRYPLQFMCAALRIRNREAYAKDCSRLGITILPPCVNKSDELYTIEGDKLRVGLTCIKHIGSKAKAIIAMRPYKDEFEFIARVKLSEKQIQSLIFAGAFDCFGDRIDIANRFCKENWGDTVSIGELTLKEKEMVGFNIVCNPLGKFEEILSKCITANGRQPQNASVGGLIIKIKEHEAKTGTMVFATLLTVDGEIEIVVWPSDYRQSDKKIVVGNVIIGNGKKTERGNYALSSISVLSNV